MTSDQAGITDDDRKKVDYILQYLIKIAALRTPVVRNVAESQNANILWLSSIPRQPSCYTRVWGLDEEHGPDNWIEIKQLPEPKLPSVPESCKPWIDYSTLRDDKDLPEINQSYIEELQDSDSEVDRNSPSVNSKTHHLKDHPEVELAWYDYIEEKWMPWSEKHGNWKDVDHAYTRLFAIYQEMNRLREEYELILAFGLLTWNNHKNQQIRRHLIVANVTLEFEAHLAKFVVREHPNGADYRIELDMLDPEDQPSMKKEDLLLSNIGDVPSGDLSILEGVLTAIAHSIGPESHYEHRLERSGSNSSRKPIIEFSPALILRKRSGRALTQLLTRIAEVIESGGDIPSGILDLAEIHNDTDSPNDGNPKDLIGTYFDSKNPRVYFPLPANREQLRIVDRLDQSPRILVQGPPGTGKSHTIANLVCHLLATGQRILITAKTPRALQVLEALIPIKMKSLCIFQLGSGPEEHQSLESSVNNILRERDDWDKNEATNQLQRVTEQLHLLRVDHSKSSRRLQLLRELETKSHTAVESYTGTAAAIAKSVAGNANQFTWMGDKIHPDMECTVNSQQLINLCHELRFFTQEKRTELSLVFPDSCPTREAFGSAVSTEKRTIQDEKIAIIDADTQYIDILRDCNIESIRALHTCLIQYEDAVNRQPSDEYHWIPTASKSIASGLASDWKELQDQTEKAIAEIDPLVNAVEDLHIQIPQSIDIREAQSIISDLIQYIKEGRSTGWWIFRPLVMRNYLRMLGSSRIDGRSCRKSTQFLQLHDELRLRIVLENIWRRWADFGETSNSSYRSQLLQLRELSSALSNVLALESLVGDCSTALRKCTTLISLNWSNMSAVTKISRSSRVVLCRFERDSALSDIAEIESTFLSSNDGDDYHPIVSEIIQSIKQRDTAQFGTLVDRLSTCIEERNRMRNVDLQIEKLRKDVPIFVDTLLKTHGDCVWEDRLKDFDLAWRWAKARYWIDEFASSNDPAEISASLTRLEAQINEAVGELATIRGWSFCFSRLSDAHRRHMEAWRQAIRRLGKGTGRHASRHRRDAQRHLNACREGVPAWVMPLHRVWDSVDPVPEMFDIIIVDEASQCGMESLPLLYLAKKMVIVGDDEQISPEAVGLDQDVVHNLRREYLEDFQYQSTFDVGSSLFDHGKLRYGSGMVTLREHFRCMPEIIDFSNRLCYSDTPLIPLRQYGHDRLDPLKSCFVEGGYREGSHGRAINPPEAIAVVQEIIRILGDIRYDGKTLGVIALLGHSQARLIERELLRVVGVEEMNRRRLICGDPYSFQGDERDIMLLSMVVARNMSYTSLTRAADRRRFNVAASRARDQMILFHSVALDEISTSCLRYRLLETVSGRVGATASGFEQVELEKQAHLSNRTMSPPPTPFDSWFEVDVALELVRKSYRVTPQFEIAGRRIDLVVEGGLARLAVECDGDRWHGADQYQADMDRQRLLERCGWQFYRVSESRFYANKNNALSGLWAALDQLDIRPDGSSRDCRDRGSIGGDLRQSPTVQTSTADPSRLDSRFSSDDSDRHGSGSDRSGIASVSEVQIRNAIVGAISKRPNRSCTVMSLTSRVLQELQIRTRGRPREEFEHRVARVRDVLVREMVLERYRSKNERLRLLK